MQVDKLLLAIAFITFALPFIGCHASIGMDSVNIWYVYHQVTYAGWKGTNYYLKQKNIHPHKPSVYHLQCVTYLVPFQIMLVLCNTRTMRDYSKEIWWLKMVIWYLLPLFNKYSTFNSIFNIHHSSIIIINHRWCILILSPLIIYLYHTQ